MRGWLHVHHIRKCCWKETQRNRQLCPAVQQQDKLKEFISLGLLVCGLKRGSIGFCSMLACTHQRNVLLFQLIRSHQKVMNRVQAIVCCNKYERKWFSSLSLNAPQREVLTSNNLALPLFSLIFLGEKKLRKLSCWSIKSRKKGLPMQFSCFLQLCVFFLSLKFGPMNFF